MVADEHRILKISDTTTPETVKEFFDAMSEEGFGLEAVVPVGPHSFLVMKKSG